MNIQLVFKKIFPHIIAIVIMLIVSSVYFYPAWDGKSLQGEDVVGGIGKVQEKIDFKEFEDQTVIWNGSIFSGMPDYIGAPYKGGTFFKTLFYLPQRMGVPREVASLFWYMLGFYILLISLRIKPLLSTGGAIGFALTSYYIIIILAGHYNKVYTLALIPPALAGILLCFNRRYLWGFILIAFFLAMQINMAHIQMIYYFLLGLICIGAVELFYHFKEKTLGVFAKNMAVIIVAAILGIAPNFSRLISYYKYNDHSIRGSSELSIGKEKTKTKNGLDKDYINSWSSGVDESMMIMVPNVKGGFTRAIKQDRELLSKVPRQYKGTIGNFNQYWGEQIFSGGPSYLGTVFLMLFLMGAFLIKGRFKWAFVIPTILYLLLSMGGNLSIFTDLFIYYVPMYNKFRAPVSILAVATIMVTLLGVYTLHQIINDEQLLQKKAKLSIFKKPKPTYLLVSAGVLIILMINVVFPDLFNSYLSQNEITQFNSFRQQASGSQVDKIVDELVKFRIGVFRTDLWRAIIFIVLVTGILFLYERKKIKNNVLIILVVVISIIDLWGIGRRYVPIEEFKKASSQVKKVNEITENDLEIYAFQINQNPEIQNIIEDYYKKFEANTEDKKNSIKRHVINKYSHYRVLNTLKSPFLENVTSKYHRSIGGYHAVKLGRYQDLIEHHISKSNHSVLNMLNTKYVINQQGVQINHAALGEGWFVDSIKWVENATDEILALNEIDVSKEVVVNSKYKEILENPTIGNSSEDDRIELTDYSPDNMKYTVSTSSDRMAVFSEIYYPDWKVLIDGEESKYVQANYVLRAMNVPKGEHIIEFIFHPKHYYLSNIISQIAFYILMCVLLIAVGKSIIQYRKDILPIKS